MAISHVQKALTDRLTRFEQLRTALNHFEMLRDTAAKEAEDAEAHYRAAIRAADQAAQAVADAGNELGEVLAEYMGYLPEPSEQADSFEIAAGWPEDDPSPPDEEAVVLDAEAIPLTEFFGDGKTISNSGRPHP